MDSKANTAGLNKELNDWKHKCDDLDRKLHAESKELRQIAEQVRYQKLHR